MPSTMVETTYYCDSCGDEVDTDWGYFCESCSVWRCDTCGECAGEDNHDSRVHVWDYRPNRFRPKGNHRTEALFGVELEVGGHKSTIANVVARHDDLERHLYMKEDGSIRGVEIVSHPMTLAWARNEFPFATLLESLREAGCYVNDGYGLHIHVSRNAFQRDGKASAAHQMMWLLFMYRNAAMLEKLARRTSERWAAFHKPQPGELARKAKSVLREDRYVAVNCNNEKTFELRFFKSTLDEREFYAALEFADASVRYTRSITIQDVLRGRAITWAHFAKWVKRHNYRNLSAELGR